MCTAVHIKLIQYIMLLADWQWLKSVILIAGVTNFYVYSYRCESIHYNGWCKVIAIKWYYLYGIHGVAKVNYVETILLAFSYNKLYYVTILSSYTYWLLSM